MSMESEELRQIAGQQIGEDVFDWGRLSEEVAETILARVPVSGLVRARAVSKQWKSIIEAPGFSALHRRGNSNNPWLFVYCTNFLLPGKNQAYAFDPDAQAWHAVPSVCPPSHARASMAGGPGGIMYATAGGSQSRLCYNHSLFVKKWKQTSEMAFSRDAPLVGFLEGGSSPIDGDVVAGAGAGAGVNAGRSNLQLIAVGGVEIEEHDDLAVEIYDTALNQWEVAKSLPEQFRGNSSRHWLSGAVWQGRLYVLEIYSGTVAHFDLASKDWSLVRALRPLTPSGVKYAYLVVCSGMLLLAGVCHPPEEGGDRVYFKLWLVDDSVMQCKEVGVMPAEIFSHFLGKGGGEKNVQGMKCVASGSLVYVYSVSTDGDYPMVVCDISQGWNAWKKLPDLPSMAVAGGNRPRFDAMVGFCSCVTLDSFF